MDELFTAANTGDIEKVQKVLQKGVSIETLDRAGRTILCYAVTDKEYAMAEFLIGQGAAVNHKDKAGFTPLHFACQANDLKLIKLLVEHGADVNAREQWGNTPLISTLSPRNINKKQVVGNVRA